MTPDLSKGMHWIGHPASLHPVADYGTIGVEDAVEPVFHTSLGGRVRAAVPRHRPLRSWSMSIPDAHADDVAPLRDIVTSLLPPYVLVTAEAQVSNVLTPERAAMLDSTPALGMTGAWPLDGGRFATTARTNPNASFSREAPVTVGPAPTPPVFTGRPVTATAYIGTNAQNGAYVTLEWLDAMGSPVGSPVAGNTVDGMDMLRRSTVTATPPAGAVACNVVAHYANVLAMPQITWTSEATPEWSPGNGADHVLVTSLGRSTSLQVPGQYALRRGDYNIAFREVGP